MELCREFAWLSAAMARHHTVSLVHAADRLAAVVCYLHRALNVQFARMYLKRSLHTYRRTFALNS